MNNKQTKFSLLAYILFLLTCSVISATSILIFIFVHKSTKNLSITIFLTFLSSAFLALNCTYIDLFRRKLLEKPVNDILNATNDVIQGNMKTRINPTFKGGQFEDFDKIALNLNKMIEELNNQELFNKEFISNFSHEIKTPLSIIQNCVMALQNKNFSKETKDEYINTIIKTTKNLSDLVSNILKLNKLENQKISIDKKNVNIGEFVRQKTLEFIELFENKNIELNCEIDDVFIKTDIGLYEIIVNNLISNAIKFTNEGGKISIFLTQINNEIVFKVKDNGCGMDKNTGNRIFDKFYQGDTSHSKEGNGLGLSLVKKVVEVLDGTIYVESELNKGSIFIVKLHKNS